MSPAACVVSPAPSAGGRWVPYQSVPGHLPSPGGPGSTLGTGRGHRPACTYSTRTSQVPAPRAHSSTDSHTHPSFLLFFV